MVTTAPVKRDSRYPFVDGTRQRIKPIGNIAYELGKRPSIDIPRVGFLAGIYGIADLTVTLSSGGALSPLNSAEGIIPRVNVETNLGSGKLVDVSLTALRSFLNDQWVGDSAIETMRSAPVASGANRWVVPFYIPIALNDGREMQTGPINLQAPEITARVDLTFASAGSEFVSNFSSVTGTVELYYLYYEVPDPRRYQWPPMIVHKLLQDRVLVSATGDIVYTVPRQGQLLSLGGLVVLNGALALAGANTANNSPIQTIRLIAQKSDTIYEMSASAFLLNFAMRHGRAVTPHMYGFDFLDAVHGQVGEGGPRDTLDSEALTTLEFVPTIASGATIGSTAYIDIVRRFTQVLQY